jgi:DNA-binding beta-propeller fold protein YncE
VASEANGIYPVAITASGSSITLTAGAPVAGATSNSEFLAVDPTPGSSVLYSADGGSISGFTFTSAGALTMVSSQLGTYSGFFGYGGPTGLCVDSTGTSVFASSGGDLGVWPFPASAGMLSAPGKEAKSSASNGPNQIVLNPQGTYLVAGNTDGTIDAFPVSGAKLSKAKTTSASSNPNANVIGLAFDPTGSFLVTANGASDDVTLFSFSGGVASAIGNPTAITGTGPAGVIFDPSGTVAYVANTGASPASISAFSVSTSGLTPLAGSPFALPASDSGPSGMVIK